MLTMQARLLFEIKLLMRVLGLSKSMQSYDDNVWLWQRYAKAKSWKMVLSQLISDGSECDPDEYRQEIMNNRLLQDSANKHKTHTTRGFKDLIDGTGFSAVILLYVLCRIVKPETLIETGCCTGWTSALILAALNKNERGHLYTIDLPAMDGVNSMDWTLPQGLPCGYLVPDEYKDRWQLILGDAKDELPKLLERVKKVDLFYHDSNHTYEHMIWEYRQVYPFMQKGSYLVSDDIGWNLSFKTFCLEKKLRPTIIRHNLNFGATAVKETTEAP